MLARAQTALQAQEQPGVGVGDPLRLARAERGELRARQMHEGVAEFQIGHVGQGTGYDPAQQVMAQALR